MPCHLRANGDRQHNAAISVLTALKTQLIYNLRWQTKAKIRRIASSNQAPVAQLDRVLGYEPSGREFESLQARHP